MNDDYLDPDIHLWPQCDDDRCSHCGYKFPADSEIEEGSLMDNGFCSLECFADSEIKNSIPTIRPLFEFLCAELQRDTVEGWSKSVYKGTSCGAWLSLLDADTIQLGSIVEGSDVECQTETLSWPFTSDRFWGALEEIEKEAAFYWDRDNSTWFTAEFTPIDKPTQTYYGRECWGEIDWEVVDVPSYVINKTAQWFKDVGHFDAYDKPVTPCLGLKLTEYCNDMVY